MSSFRHAGIAALALVGMACVGPSRAEQVLVASLVDDIVYADLVANGDCSDGCRREEHAVAHVSGTPQTRSCELQTITPFDPATPEPGLLRASIYCEDSTGALIEQGTGPCKFDICVDFSWTDGEGDNEGQLTYDVVIVRDERPRAPHTVYVDLSVAIDPTVTNGNVDSCAKNGSCVTKECTAPDGYPAEIALTDERGDGWVGGVAGYYNLWTLIDVNTDTIKNRGTLADNHYSATIMECLSDGDYVFNTTANAAWAEDMGWDICDHYGGPGEGLRFTVAGGMCDSENAEMIERATVEETSDASSSYCTLPAPLSADDYRTSTCTTLSSGMKIEGVGLYYDDRCTSSELSGCGARSIAGCRICFVDRDLWRLTVGDGERMPDWEDCPCCVATTLGVECKTDGGGGGSNKGVIIAVSVSIAGVIAIACCLSCAFGTTIVRFFRRLNKKKHAEMELDLDENVASAFPDSPTAGGGGGSTIRGTGLTNQGNRNRGHSGHFPIPRFDSIRGRFDSGIFSSNATGAYASNAVGGGGGSGGIHAGAHVAEVGGGHNLEKVRMVDEENLTTAQSTPSGTGAKGSQQSAPRSTVLDDRLVSQGFTTSDVGRPVSMARSSNGNSGTGGGSRQESPAGWGLAMSADYPDLEGADPYAIDNVMVETGTLNGGGGARNLE